MPLLWVRALNALLASLVVTFGFWIVWSELSSLAGTAQEATPLATGLVAVASFMLLLWRADTIAAIWAWATLWLGLESLAWPLAIMTEVRLTSAEPTEAQMGRILVAVLFGLFSSIFWLTFAYGIFKWIRRKAERSVTS